jgi:hypothetical protein
MIKNHLFACRIALVLFLECDVSSFSIPATSIEMLCTSTNACHFPAFRNYRSYPIISKLMRRNFPIITRALDIRCSLESKENDQIPGRAETDPPSNPRISTPDRPLSHIMTRLRKRSGAPSVVLEYARPSRLTPHSVAALSRALRAGGAALIAVNMDDDEDGCVDLAAFAAEQAAAAAAFPPTVPVFARLCRPATPTDAGRARTAGAAGMLAPIGGADAAELRAAVDASTALGLEVILEVADEGQVLARPGPFLAIQYSLSLYWSSRIEARFHLAATVSPRHHHHRLAL